MRTLFFTIFYFSFLCSIAQQNTLIKQLRDSSISSPNPGYWFGRIAHDYFNQNQFDSAKFYYYKSLIVGNPNNIFQQAFIKNNLGALYAAEGVNDSSIFFYTSAIADYNKIDSTTKAADCLLNIAIIYKDMGAYEKSLELLINAAQLLENKNKERSLSSCYNTIATIYSKQKDWKGALLYYKQSLFLRKKLNLEKLVAASYNNIGIIFKMMHEYDSALFYYNKSLQIKEDLTDSKGIGATLNNIGMIYIDKKEYNKAEPYLLKALDIRDVNYDLNGTAITLNSLGQLYLHIGQFEKSLIYLNNASKIIYSAGFLDELKSNLEYKLKVYEELGNSSEGLNISKKLLTIKDSLLNKEKTESLIEMQTKYESEKKQREIELLEQNQVIYQAKLNLQQTWLIGFITIITLLIVIGVLINHQRAKERINGQKIQTLLNELHHRVKNNLQLLSSIFSLQSRSIVDQNALEAVKNGENRVNAMALIHQKLYKTDSRSLFIDEYLSELVTELADSFGYNLEDKSITIKIERIEVDVDKIIPVGLIINEVVSNSFKYAFQNNDNPKLKIEVVKVDKKIIIKIEDNGNGFNKDELSTGSMGLRIVETLGRQIRAKINWNTSGKVEFNMFLPL